MKLVTIDGEEFRVQGAVVVVGADGAPLAPGTGSGDASAANQATGNTKIDATNIKLDTANTRLNTLIAAIGAAGDAAGANTMIGLLKQIVLNTTPAP